MPVSITGMPKIPKRAGLVSTEEWIELMNRVFDLIGKQLEQLEHKAAKYNRVQGGEVFTANDARALGAIASTIARVRVVNDGINYEQLSAQTQRQLNESRAKQEELERRLARLAESGEDS